MSNSLFSGSTLLKLLNADPFLDPIFILNELGWLGVVLFAVVPLGTFVAFIGRKPRGLMFSGTGLYVIYLWYSSYYFIYFSFYTRFDELA